VEAAGVEPEVDTTTVGVYADLPNVYRMNDVLVLGTQSFFVLKINEFYFNLSIHYFISLLFPA
jgi:hypothetical protein